MKYLVLVLLGFLAWQDIKKRSIRREVLLGLWLVLLPVKLLGLTDRAELFKELTLLLAALLVSAVVIWLGREKHIGKGDVLTSIWLLTAASPEVFLTAAAWGLMALWLWAVWQKLRKRKELIPWIPFLWGGYLAACFF